MLGIEGRVVVFHPPPGAEGMTPLAAIDDHEGRLWSLWRTEEAERQELAAGGLLVVTVWHGSRPVQPLTFGVVPAFHASMPLCGAVGSHGRCRLYALHDPPHQVIATFDWEDPPKIDTSKRYPHWRRSGP